MNNSKLKKDEPLCLRLTDSLEKRLLEIKLLAKNHILAWCAERP